MHGVDPLARGELDGFKRRAKAMASLFNEGEVIDMNACEWLVANNSRLDFGDRVTDESIGDGVVLRESAIIERNGEEVFARMVAVSDKAVWILAIENTKGDIRLLGEHRGAEERGSWTSRRGSACFGVVLWMTGPWFGPEPCRNIVLQTSGVFPFSAVSRERIAVRVGVGVGQLDLSNILRGEIAVRRQVQIETRLCPTPATPLTAAWI